MLNSDASPLCGVLFVDDEEMALKYFRRAFDSRFPVFTANSGAEGLELLRREAGRIGIVLTDQRMPGMFGAEFLGRVREEFPLVVRILTTAYSDLKDAIAAVNTGHIYQYVVKPWEVDELAMVLQRASDYYHVLVERNELLALKMTTLQRILCSDRLKWLLLWSRALPAAEQAAFRRALVAFVQALPLNLNPPVATARRSSAQQFEIAGLLRNEYRNAVLCLDTLEAFRAAPAPESIEAALQPLVAALAALPGLAPEGVSLQLDTPPTAARLRLQSTDRSLEGGALVRRLFGLLLEQEAPEVSLILFQALQSLVTKGVSLEIFGEFSGGGQTVSFLSGEISGEAEEAIEALAEKIAAADIARL